MNEFTTTKATSARPASSEPRANAPVAPATSFAPPPFTPQPTRGRARRSPSSRSPLQWVLIGLAVLAVAALMFGGGLLRNAGGQDSGIALGVSDRTYSYYHDQRVERDTYSNQWDKGDALLGAEDRWEYDGTYDYEGYGSAGIAQRRKGKGTDPLFSTQPALPNVFDEYGLSADPTAGDPVGPAWTDGLDPTYSPYAGHSNPYSNRLRMAFGPGADRGAYHDR